MILVAPGKKDALKEGILQALRLHKHSYHPSSAQVRAKFDWKRGVEAYFNCYQKLI